LLGILLVLAAARPGDAAQGEHRCPAEMMMEVGSAALIVFTHLIR
jgi:hypothetical protein